VDKLSQKFNLDNFGEGYTSLQLRLLLVINYSYFFVLSIKDLVDQSIVKYYVLTALSYCNQKLFVNLN
jgi:hypothetical protein